MKKRPTPSQKPSAHAAQFYTDNPREQRALALLLQRPARREELDRAAGCSNAPDLIAGLRRRGLALPCERVPAMDRDGRPCRPGVYHLTASDRRAVHGMLRQRGFFRPDVVTMLALLSGPAIAAAVTLSGWLR